MQQPCKASVVSGESSPAGPERLEEGRKGALPEAVVPAQGEAEGTAEVIVVADEGQRKILHNILHCRKGIDSRQKTESHQKRTRSNATKANSAPSDCGLRNSVRS